MNHWDYFYHHLQTFLPIFPYYQYIIDSLFTSSLSTLPNMLLYGPTGFPAEILIEYALSIYVSSNFPIQKRYPFWNHTLPYIETHYYFCLDTDHPEFPKDIHVLTDFIKHIISSKCIHMERHIIILKNIEKITHTRQGNMFRVLLERFTQNVLFLCTTHRIHEIEKPILSRTQLYRIPLPTLTQIKEVIYCINPKCTIEPLSRNLVQELLFLEHPQRSNFHYPPILGLQKMKCSQTDIRHLASKLFQYQITLGQLIHDCLRLIKTDSKKIQWIQHTSTIEHQSKLSDPLKRVFYFELVLNLFELYKNPK